MRMKLGIITSHDEAGVAAVRRYGLDYAEFDVNADDIDYITDRQRVDSILAAMKKYDVAIGAIGRWGRQRICSDGSFNLQGLDKEKRLIDLCVELGCPVYITGCNYVDGLSYYANVTAAIGYFSELLDHAKDSVKICTYNCSWDNYVDKPREWSIIHGHLPKLGIKFDPSHSVNGGRDYLREAGDWSSRFYHVHLKGTLNVDGIHVDDPPAGLDMINWGALISILRKSGYDGVLSFEPHSSTWSGELGEKGLEYSIKFIKEMTF